MRSLEKGITTLLRCAITGESLPLPDDFELEKAYELAKKHHMYALIYEGAIRCGLDKKQPVMQRLFRDYCKALMISEGQLAALKQLYSAFDENRIDYMPLKGSRMKYLYPKPELRHMGDADILIRVEQYDRIKPVMESLGFEERGGWDHELVWRSKQLYLELHKRIVPSSEKKLYSWFGDGWRFAAEHTGVCYSMTPEDETVFLFAHFTKHFMDCGIGCRHMVDMWVWFRSNPELNEEYIRKALEELKMYEFYGYIRCLLKGWFEGGETDDRLEAISCFIFDSGSYGSVEVGIQSAAVRNQHSRSKMAYFMKKMFPGADVLESEYKILKKAPWILPLVWVYRLVYKLIWDRKAFKQRAKVFTSVNQAGIDKRKELLEQVGLGFNE